MACQRWSSLLSQIVIPPVTNHFEPLNSTKRTDWKQFFPIEPAIPFYYSGLTRKQNGDKFCFPCFKFQCHWIFWREQNGVSQSFPGAVSDYHSAGFRPRGDVKPDVFYPIHTNVYREMWLFIFNWWELTEDLWIGRFVDQRWIFRESKNWKSWIRNWKLLQFRCWRWI